MTNNNYENVLTSYEIDFLKKIGEYDNIISGLNMLTIINKLPANFDEFFVKFKKVVPEKNKSVETWLKDLAKEDPKFFQETVAVFTVLADMKDSEKKVEKLSKKELEEAELKQALDIFSKKMKVDL